jgi:hypothetical protein
MANAVIWVSCVNLIYLHVLGDSFHYLSLFELGSFIYVGLVMSLHLKVSLLHHMINRIQVWAMIISILGLFLIYFILNSFPDGSEYDFYGVINHVYANPLFWFFGFFSGPVIFILIDLLGYSIYMFFFPLDETVFHEASLFSDNSRSPSF